MKSPAALSIPAGLGSGGLAVQLMSDVPGYGKAGQTVQLTLSPSDVIISAEMDTFMVGFRPQGFRADEVCPIELVDLDIGQYRSFGLNNAFRQVTSVVSSIQADIPEVDVDTTLVSYRVQERALGGFIPTVTQQQAELSGNGLDPKMAIGRRVAQALGLEREIRVWNLLKTAGTWNANNRATISVGAEWNDIDNGDVMQDLFDRIEASAQLVTDIWVNPQVAHAIVRSKSVREHMRTLRGDQGVDGAIADAAGTQKAMDFQIAGLPPIHVVASKVLNETTGMLDFILDDTVILTGAPSGGTTTGEDIMTCKSFRRRGPSGTGWTTREFALERRGLHGGTFLASGYAEQIVIVASTVGGAIFDVLQ